MIEKNDGRLRNQANWLTGVALAFGRFRQITEDFDHAHCEFCWAKFMDKEYRTLRGYETPPDVRREGYHMPDGLRWICDPYFDDFREMFGWIVVNEG